MNRPLGCLTGGGLLAGVLTLVLLAAFYFFTGGAMFSPGPLNAETGEAVSAGAARPAVRSHAEIAGDCSACHPPPWSRATLADRCLACHANVADELQGKEGLHGILQRQSTSFGCRGCHPEHRGPAAALTEVQPQVFPHAATGYELAGHRTMPDGRAFACGDCHAKSVTEFAAATCTDCHRQIDAGYMTEHLGDFGEACLSCHDGVDRYSRKRFDHNALAFPLQGKHAEIGCSDCHRGAATVAELQSAKRGCVDCHLADDKHEGQFGTDCAACHNATSWPDAQFDHSKTAFPLTGKHTDTTCETCHPGGVFKGTAQTCIDCHRKDDTHKGQYGSDCGACHNTSSWPDAQFDHAKTAFPLTGKHAGVKCEDCHQGGVFTGAPTDCAACHADPPYHLGAFATRCADCHNADGWQPATFNLSHTFPIDHGEDGPSPCRTCHPSNVKVYTCYGCHEHTEAKIIDKHAGEVEGDISDCVKCHPTGHEKEAKKEDRKHD